MAALKKIFLLSLLAGVLAACTSLAYNYVYCSALQVDYGQVLSVPAVFGASIMGSVLAGLGYFALYRKWGSGADLPFNIIYVVLSLLCFAGPFTTQLPLDLHDPELFVGVAIPMHLFPVLFWLVLRPGLERR